MYPLFRLDSLVLRYVTKVDHYYWLIPITASLLTTWEIYKFNQKDFIEVLRVFQKRRFDGFNLKFIVDMKEKTL